jgi:hypothetical protein
MLTTITAKGSLGRKPSTLLHVYEVERDVVISHDFEPKYVIYAFICFLHL